MASAKDIILKPITSKRAIKFVKANHYSGKVAAASQLHFGVFLNDIMGGVMQFGPSLDKRKTMRLVEGTKWNGFLELNRMVFTDRLPKNAESRALAISFMLIKRLYPHIEWIISFADGTQCGDGTIYRAAGFDLTGIKKNTTIWQAPDGSKHTDIGLRLGSNNPIPKGKPIKKTGASSMKVFKEMGFTPLPGFQLRYVYFLNPEARKRLTVPILPYSRIDEMGAGMYKGKRRVSSAGSGTSGDQLEGGGASPTGTLQPSQKDRD